MNSGESKESFQRLAIEGKAANLQSARNYCTESLQQSARNYGISTVGFSFLWHITRRGRGRGGAGRAGPKDHFDSEDTGPAHTQMQIQHTARGPLWTPLQQAWGPYSISRRAGPRIA